MFSLATRGWIWFSFDFNGLGDIVADCLGLAVYQW